jgi:hypothetical protein
MPKKLFHKISFIIITVIILVFTNSIFAQGRSDQAFERVRQVQQRNTARLMAMQDVEGTAIGYNQTDQAILSVFAAGEGVKGIPRNIEGVPVEIVVTGKIYALAPGGKNPKPEKKPSPAPSIDPTDWFARPVPIGVSTGNANECSAGTIGCRVTDGKNVYALSNNHVYARENDAITGESILQPGLYDTSCRYSSDNIIGQLAQYEKISFTGNNQIDAAIALVNIDEETVGNSTPSNGYGTPDSDIAGAYVGQTVQKYGRTTSLTKGTVRWINVTINVSYSSGIAIFTDQICVYNKTAFIKPGDSGSLLITQNNNNPVGLLFAGDATGRYAYANRIDYVLSNLNVSIDGK